MARVLGEIDAKAYVLWGGQYDVRELELVEYQGAWSFDDITGGHYSFSTVQCESKREAKRMLAGDVFRIGEPGSFIDFGDEGVLRDRDPEAWFIAIGEPHYELFAKQYVE